jgi:branched-chain amino acid transport system permease protein
LSSLGAVSGILFFRRHSRFFFALLIAALLGFPLFFPEDPYIMRIAINVILYSMLATSLNMINGYSGQFSIGHAAFYCIGAYTAAILSTRWGWGFWLCLPVSGLMAAFVSFFLSAPTAKLKGVFLALCTIGFSEIVRLVALNWVSLTRGPMGMPGIPSPSIFGHELLDNRELYYLVLFLCGFCMFVCSRVLKSRLGRAWMAIREDELAARAMGVPTRRYKMYNFAFATFWAGVAGCFYAFMANFVSSDSFSNEESFAIISIVLVGGQGFMAGGPVGALILTVLPELIRFLAEYRQIVFGLAILFTMHFAPRGLVGKFVEWTARLDREAKDIDMSIGGGDI